MDLTWCKVISIHRITPMTDDMCSPEALPPMPPGSLAFQPSPVASRHERRLPAKWPHSMPDLARSLLPPVPLTSRESRPQLLGWSLYIENLSPGADQGFKSSGLTIILGLHVLGPNPKPYNPKTLNAINPYYKPLQEHLPTCKVNKLWLQAFWYMVWTSFANLLQEMCHIGAEMHGHAVMTALQRRQTNWRQKLMTQFIQS